MPVGKGKGKPGPSSSAKAAQYLSANAVAGAGYAARMVAWLGIRFDVVTVQGT